MNILTKLGKIKFKIIYYSTRILLYLFVLPKKSYGAEIGVRWGGNAKLLYYLTRPMELILVDSYEELEIHSPEVIKGMIDRVQKWVRNRNILLYKESSKETSTWYFEYRGFSFLDWVYIDADHEDLYNDLTYWYDNLCDGGIIMGDDYGSAYPQIKVDLKRFCTERNLKYKTLHYQWWLKK